MAKDLLSADGVATLDISTSVLGAHVVTARYSGSSDFTRCRSLVGLGQEVRGTTTATLSSVAESRPGAVSPSP